MRESTHLVVVERVDVTVGIVVRADPVVAQVVIGIVDG